MLLATLARAGFKANKGTFVGLALLVALMAATLTFALCLYTDLNERQGRALEEAGAGAVLIASNKAELPDAFVDEIAALEKVEAVKVTESLVASTNHQDASGEQLGGANTLNISYQPWGEAIDFAVFSDDAGGLKTFPHANAAPPAKGEVYVPVGTQATLGLEQGDTVVVSIGATDYRFTVARFVEDPQLGSPFVEMSQYLVSDEDFASMYRAAQDLLAPASGLLLQAEAGVAYPARTLNIAMTDEARLAGMTSAELAAYIDENVSAEGLSTGFLSAEVLTGYAMLVVLISCALLLVFALLMYVIALVISVHTVSSTIQENFSNFAILKAVGVTGADLRRSLVVQYGVCTVLGCGAGAAVGLVAVPLGLPAFAQLTGVLAQPLAPGPLVWIALGVLVAVIVVSVSVKTGQVARVSPLAALRSGIGDVHFSSRMAVCAAGRPLGLRLAWRALTSAKRSYVGLFACALLLAAFVMLTFGIGASLRTMGDSYRAFGIWQSDVSVRLSDGVAIEEVVDCVEETVPVKQLWQEGFSMQNIRGESRSVVGLSDFAVTSGIAEGAAPAYDNEAVVGYKLAESLGLSIGDELVVSGASGEEHTYLVSGLLSAMFNAGYGILMTYDGLGLIKQGAEAAGQSYQMILEDSSLADSVRERLAERFGDAVDLTDTGIFASTRDLMVLIHDLFIFVGYGMDGVAVLLAVLAVSLIMRRMFDMERRDLGIYRALGFTALRLRGQFALRFLIVSLLGCAAAGVLVRLGGAWLTSQLFGTFGVTRFALDTSLPLLGCVGCGVALVFFGSAFLSARAIRTVSASVLITE